jgi:hypothetical protein
MFVASSTTRHTQRLTTALAARATVVATTTAVEAAGTAGTALLAAEAFELSALVNIG